MTKRSIIFSAIITYIITMSLYFFLSVNLGNTPLYLQMRRFVPASICFVLPFFFLKDISIKHFSISLIVSLICATTSPLLTYLTYGNSATYLSYPYDFAMGLYLFPILVLLPIVLQNILKAPKIISVLFNVLTHIFFLLPCFLQFAYYAKFNHCLTEKGTMAIYQTNISEATEYISSLGVLGVVCLVLISAIAFIIYKYVDNLASIVLSISLNKFQKAFSLIILLSFSFYICHTLWHKAYFGELVQSTVDYFSSIKSYRNGRNDILANLTVSKNANSKKPETIIVVIGESATRNYMSAFTPMADNTTPWLTANKTNPNFILLQNAYSCEYNTGPSLSHALTESNYYTNLNFNKSLSFIDVAKKAGFETYWFSNQGVIGPADTPITLVAETSNHIRWICQDDTKTQYDGELVNYLKNVDPNKNNLVVIHIMGSHIDYNNRYPKEFQKWTDPGETGRLADYKNSLLYTDHVLQQIFEYANANFNLSTFLYFSDHGNDPLRSRDPDTTKFVGLRIPAFIYYSDEYKEEHKSVVSALESNKNKFISNDLMYETICGLMDIKSNHYDEKYSITSASYFITKENMLTGGGKRHLDEDPYLK